MKIGASGKFPHGKIHDTDEGELTFAITHDPKDGLVHIRFGKPVAWLAFPPSLAISMARLLLRHAGVRKVEIEL